VSIIAKARLEPVWPPERVPGIIRLRSGAQTVPRLPPGITQTQSYTWVLRETFVATLQPFFAGWTIRRTNQDTILQEHLPVLGVYILGERMTPDGDWDAGEVRFIHDFQIGFSIMIANNDTDLVEQKLDAYWWTLMNGLWRNVSLMNLINSQNADNTRTEGVILGNRRFVYGTVGKNNETPVGEIQYEATCKYRTEFGAIITDTLDKVVISVVPVGVAPTVTQVPIVVYAFDYPAYFSQLLALQVV
jgi:hypothetical protein